MDKLQKLEDLLLILKFNPDRDDFITGQIEAIKFCIRKHQQGWGIEDFKKDLDKTFKLNLQDDYIQGIVSGLNLNLRIIGGE